MITSTRTGVEAPAQEFGVSDTGRAVIDAAWMFAASLAFVAWTWGGMPLGGWR
jgi:hypothetical protein